MIYFAAAFRNLVKKVDIFFCWVLCMLKPPAKIISMQEETISIQNKQNEELAEMLSRVLGMTESGE